MIQPEELYRLLHQTPFQPVRIHLTDGRVFDIRHEHLATVGKTYCNIGIPLPNDPDPWPLYDYVETVDLVDIDRVEPLLTPVST
jgi:hypothetical protein